MNPDDLSYVERGEIGELLIKGKNLAQGYWRKDELTKKSFVWATIATENSSNGGSRRLIPCSPGAGAGAAGGAPAERYFRTGDFGWIGADDGAIRFVGRRDQQIKVRGHRVELLEVEEAIKGMYSSSSSSSSSSSLSSSSSSSSQEEMGQQKEEELALRESSVVCVSWRNPVRIVAYVTPANSNVTKMREDCRKTLPEYMVPSRFLPIPALPLLPNGKLDRKLLATELSHPQNPYTVALVSGALGEFVFVVVVVCCLHFSPAVLSSSFLHPPFSFLLSPSYLFYFLPVLALSPITRS